MKQLDGALDATPWVVHAKRRWRLPGGCAAGILAFTALVSCQMLAGLNDRRTASGAAAGQAGVVGGEGSVDESGATGEAGGTGERSGSGGQRSGGRASPTAGGQAEAATETAGTGADGTASAGTTTGDGKIGGAATGGTGRGGQDNGGTSTGSMASGGTGVTGGGGPNTGGAVTGGAAGADTGQVASGPIEAGGATAGENATGGRAATGGASTGGGLDGGTTANGGTTATGGTSATGGTPSSIPLPCDVVRQAGQPCVSAHSTVRVIVGGYTGPLYQVCKGSFGAGPSACTGTPQDIGVVDGFADAAAHEAFCAGATCTITKIYDQSGQGNHLEPAPPGGNKASPGNPARAMDLKTTVHGYTTYGILIRPNVGYRTGCNGCNIKQGNGLAKGDEPQTIYMVTSQKDLVDSCCFDYGNAETTSNDEGNGTVETVYFGGGAIWGTGLGGKAAKPGPWVMADLENGLFAGWENGQDQNISTNVPLKYDFVTAIVVGDTADKNGGKGRFAIYGGDATAGALTTLYDGIRPEKPGYVPMTKQGSLILGTGGDNSNGDGGRFYEGITANGVATKETLDALQAAIVAVEYGK
jgi:hypothetical protein